MTKKKSTTKTVTGFMPEIFNVSPGAAKNHAVQENRKKAAAKSKIDEVLTSPGAQLVGMMPGDIIADKAATKTTGRPKIKGREYLIKNQDPFGGGIAKQAYNIWQVLVMKSKADSDKWYSEGEVQIWVEEAKVNGMLKTKQPAWRIFQYYRAQLISAGSLKMRNAE